MKIAKDNNIKVRRIQRGGAISSQKMTRHCTRQNSACQPKVFIKTFGCQMNDRDSEAVAGLFLDAGYRLVDNPKDADVILVNTCSVRQHEIGRAHV